jgi:hypothetical protein
MKWGVLSPVGRRRIVGGTDREMAISRLRRTPEDEIKEESPTTVRLSSIRFVSDPLAI